MNKNYTNIDIKSIKEYKLNNKKHPQSQIDIIKKSIEETWYIWPIVVDEKNTILAWHGRLKALKQLNYDNIDVIQVDWLTEEQKKRYRILDNRSSDFSEYDLDNLRVDLTSLWDTSLDDLFSTFDFSVADWQNENTNNAEFYKENVEAVPDDAKINEMLKSVEVPDVEKNTVRWLLIPIPQEIYEETKEEFLQAMRNWVDIWPLILDLLKNENSKS